MKKWKVVFWPTAGKHKLGSPKEMVVRVKKFAEIRQQIETYYPECQICSAVRY